MKTIQSLKPALRGALVLLLLPLLHACGDSQPVKGFVLPEGDIARGEQVFVEYNCHACHSIPGSEFPAPAEESPIQLAIGGEVYLVKDYGELLTAIVNPDHIIAPRYLALLDRSERDLDVSPMPNYDEEMSVAELVDLVEFLHAQYSELQPQFYRGYYLVR